MAHHPHRLWLAGSSLAALLAATPAFAQGGSGTGGGGSGNATASSATSAEAAPNDNGQTIVITATKREQLLIDVPFSVNAQTEADIQRSGANTIEDLSRNVAGLTVQNLGPGQSQV
ncbi:MAG: iron complex outerrane recepter protein, partial [Sphingomonadales bacterium]|nr:iron complex outerrane recepter protein [Sphingomonadales bacterium]